MSKHTPGPWTFGHYGMSALWVGPDHEQKPVARVPHDSDDEARDESRENARLMAAAPELLEALQTLLPMLVDWHDDFPDCVGDKEAPALKAARAAIAKAMGEA